jgi:hypothetical protein
MNITNLTKVVILDDDPANNMIGTVLTNTFYEGERHYIIRLDYEYRGHLGRRRELDQDGWEYEFEETTIEVSEVIVPESRVELAPWYVNVYELWMRCYSAAEGGCYTTDKEHVITEGPYATEAEARENANLMRLGEYADTGKSSSVIYSGGEYEVRVENKPGVNEPSPITHYS